MQADAPDRAIPYPIKTAAGLTNKAKRVELALVNDAIAVSEPVIAESQSTASLNKKGTWTFITYGWLKKILKILDENLFTEDQQLHNNLDLNPRNTWNKAQTSETSVTNKYIN